MNLKTPFLALLALTTSSAWANVNPDYTKEHEQEAIALIQLKLNELGYTCTFNQQSIKATDQFLRNAVRNLVGSRRFTGICLNNEELKVDAVIRFTTTKGSNEIQQELGRVSVSWER